MAALPWGVIIIDESHNLRTTNSRGADSPHTEAAVAAGAAAARLILLSGTPSLSRPYDLFRQVDVLVPGLLGRSKDEFAHRWVAEPSAALLHVAARFIESAATCYHASMQLALCLSYC
jgi:SNF2 family DNA or RNA helicase